MATVYLCIGTPKTGTTALQSFMRENEKQLQKQGYCYPELELGLWSIFKNRNAHFLVQKSTLEDEAEQEREEVELRNRGFAMLGELAKQYDNIILSDEVVWYRCNKREGFWQDTLDNFKKINCEVKVVVYLRRQDQVVQSLWNQLIKMEPRSTKDFDRCINGKYLKYFPLVYDKHLNKIARYVPKENIIVRPYEKGQFEGEEHSIYTDFFKVLGVKLTDEFTHEKVAANVGLVGNFIDIKRTLNGIPEYLELDDFMCRPVLNASKCVAQNYGTIKETMFKSYEQQKEYLACFEEGNAYVAREFMGREDGVLFKEPIEELPAWQPHPETMQRDMLVYTAEMFCRQEKIIRDLQNETKRLREELKKTQSIRSEMEQLREEVKAMHNSLIFRTYRKIRKVKKS